ncbi:MAG: hypothetical protein ABI175_23225 [Polyangiales bacterium]
MAIVQTASLVSVLWLSSIAVPGCASSASPPERARRPSSSASPIASTAATSAVEEGEQPVLDEAPKLGFLERRADGTCWYGSNPAGPLQRVSRCPETIADGSKAPPTDDAPTGGYLEKIIADGACWWAFHAPNECAAGAICRPDLPASRVRCP